MCTTQKRIKNIGQSHFDHVKVYVDRGITRGKKNNLYTVNLVTCKPSHVFLFLKQNIFIVIFFSRIIIIVIRYFYFIIFYYYYYYYYVNLQDLQQKFLYFFMAKLYLSLSRLT